MTIRKQTVIVISSLFSSVIIIVFLVARLVLLENLKKIEASLIRQNVERVENVFTNDITELELITSDWSSWDDTYEFIDDYNEEYLEDNLVDETFGPLYLNTMLFFDISGELVYGKAYDLEKEEETAIPPELVDYLQSEDLLVNDTASLEGISGLIHLPELPPMVMSALPILTSENEGPARGTLFFGRYFSDFEIERLSELTFIPLSIYNVTDSDLPDEISDMVTKLNGQRSAQRIIDSNHIAGYVLIDDICGEPHIIIEAVQSRDIYNEGLTGIAYLIVILTFTGLLFAFLALYSADKQGLSRLKRLSDTAVDIAATGNLAERVSSKGNDEISKLSASFNYMLDSLQTTMEKETELRKDLETEMKKRIEFTRALVHELKTPLTPMLTSSDMLVSELDTEPQLSMAKNINRGAERLNVRINELLDVARAEIGTLKLNLSSMEMTALVRDVIDDCESRANLQGITIEADIPESVSPVLGDDDRLQQVLLNIMNNACKFTPEDGTIRVTVREDETSVITEISDTGPGIPPEEIAKIFQPYYRSTNDPHNLRGLGLGLALCKMIVELHGGTIWVRNNDHAGSIFGFSIPVYDTK